MGAAIAALALVAALMNPGLASAQQRQVRPLIAGGQPASAGTFPWLAFVYDQVSPTEAEVCSGTVISPNVVLTAGHCGEDTSTGAVEPASGYRIVTGSLDWTDPAPTQVSAVSQVIVHPGFDPTNLDGGDAALLVLSSPTTAPAIPLAASSEAALWASGSSVAIAGWGKTSGDADTIPDQLQWGETVTQPDTPYCADEALAGRSTFDPSYELCAVDTPAYQDGTCEGDSGGPMVADYGTASPVEVGITSFGPSDCDTHDGQFFTLTSAISSWADSEIAAVAPAPIPTSAPIPSPAPTPAPTAKPSVARPAAGLYLGDTSQARTVRVRVASPQTKVKSLRLAFRLRCTRHRPLSQTVSAGPFKLKGLTFSLSLVRRRDEHIRIVGRFNAKGAVKGTLQATWHSPADGSCRTGLVRWSGWTPTS
jgi:secreted trypsin-like serine protease